MKCGQGRRRTGHPARKAWPLLVDKKSAEWLTIFVNSQGEGGNPSGRDGAELSPTDQRPERSLRDLVSVTRRRAWIIALVTALATVGALVLSLRQPARYKATAQVLLNSPTIPASVIGVDVSQDPARTAETQAKLARFPDVITRVLGATGSHLSPEQFLADTDVSAASDADLLFFSATAASPASARAFASAYAREFTRYHAELDQASFERVRIDLRRRIAVLTRRGGAETGAARQALILKEQDLQAVQALERSSGYFFKGADDATKVQPLLARNTVVGLLIGLLAGLGFAFVVETLDIRIRSSSTIGQELRLPLLARIPQSPRLRRRERGAAIGGQLRPLLARLPIPAHLAGSLSAADVPVAMLSDPHGSEAEAFRMLRTRLELERGESDFSLVAVTSGREGEGKSTVVANLAVGFARSGHKVAAVDLDLRHPSLHRLFRLDEQGPGVTEVVRRSARLLDAIVALPVGDPAAPNGSRRRPRERVVEVLPAGVPPADPSDVLDDDALRTVLDQLRTRSDVVLVDTPPLLLFDDAMRISRLADAIVVVSRLQISRGPDLGELARVLSSAPARTVGFVVVGDERESAYDGDYLDYQPPRTEDARSSP
jgi:succinoglycan biosynthesis transport protein ExoP